MVFYATLAQRRALYEAAEILSDSDHEILAEQVRYAAESIEIIKGEDHSG